MYSYRITICCGVCTICWGNNPKVTARGIPGGRHRAVGSSIASALEVLRELVESDSLDAAIAQTREILATLEHRQRPVGDRVADRAQPQFDAHLAQHRNEDDSRRIADLEAQLKGWVAAVRRANSQSVERQR